MVENIVSASIVVFSFMFVMFMIAQVIKNNSIVDIGWGIGFILITGSQLILKDTITFYHLIISLMIFIWGSRLSIHIFLRSRGKGEDFRYAEWRKEWGKNAAMNAFLKVFMFQGFIMIIIAYPIIVLFSSETSPEDIFVYSGSFIFLVGLLFETVGDYQLMKFKNDSRNRGKIITTGIWKVTRHPNYFGEAVIWWGIFIFVIGTELWYTAVISPLLINYFLVKFSGIPMLEKKYEGRKDWEEYKKVTPAFVPWVGKKG